MLDDRKSAGLLRRCLLWQRAADCDTLEKIQFGGPVGAPPSWSWMAYRGEIEYLDLPFGQVSWEEKELVSPWLGSEPGTWYSSDCATDTVGLAVIVRDLVVPVDADKGDGDSIVLDVTTGQDVRSRTLKCVVLGKLKYIPQSVSNPKTHAVLLVRSESQSAGGGQTYSRIGVGFVPEGWISHDEGLSGTLL